MFFYFSNDGILHQLKHKVMLSLLASVFASYTGLSTVMRKYSHIKTPVLSVMSTLIGVGQCLCVHKSFEEHV